MCMARKYLFQDGIIPISLNSKRPACEGWSTKTGRTDEKLRLWRNDIQKNNLDYAVLTGDVNGIMVIDVDIQKAPEETQELHRDRDFIKRFYGNTLTIRTPSGGFHFYYKYEGGIKDWTNKIGAILPFIDIKVENGYVLGHGTKTKKGEYVIENDVSVGDMPYELFQKIDADMNKSRRTFNNESDYDCLKPLLEKEGFTGVEFSGTDNFFKCDQMGRGTTCPLCSGEHANNRFQIITSQRGTYVKNMSKSCKKVCLEVRDQDATDETNSDDEHREAFIKWTTTQGYKLVNCCDELYFYDIHDGIYKDGVDKLLPILSKCDVIPKSHSQNHRGKMIILKELLHFISRDDDFLIRNENNKNKLPFLNGVYCFETKTLLPFDAKYVFFTKVRCDFKKVPQEQIDRVKREYVDTIFGNPELADAYVKRLARIISGNDDKQMTFVVGHLSSGKGLGDVCIKHSYDGFCSSIQTKSLCEKRTDGDTAKSMSWLESIANTRIWIGQEVPPSNHLDGTMIKSIASGGDKHVVRNNYKNEKTIRPDGSLFLFVNDIPKFSPHDNELQSRLTFYQTSYSYVSQKEYNRMTNPSDKIKIGDDKIKERFVKEDWTKLAFINLVADAWRDEKVFSEALEEAKDDWTDEMSIESQIKKLFSTEIQVDTGKKDKDNKPIFITKTLDPKDEDTWIKSPELDSHIVKHVKGISKKKIREMMDLWGLLYPKYKGYLYYKGIRKIDPECMFDDDY